MPRNALLEPSAGKGLRAVVLENPESVAEILVRQIPEAAPIAVGALSMSQRRALLTPAGEVHRLYETLLHYVWWCLGAVALAGGLEIASCVAHGVPR